MRSDLEMKGAVCCVSARFTGRRSGLSLFEVMVAIAVFAIAVLALISVQAFALRSQVKAQQHQQATILAVSLMAEAEARVKTDFGAMLETPSTPLMETENLPEGYTYTAQQSFETADVQRITLKVRWTDGNGPQEYELWTKFAQ